MVLHETLPLPLAQTTAPSSDGPIVRLSARSRVLRLRRELPTSASGRAWVLELELEVPEIDPERLLTECEGFLVDGRGGGKIGVVDCVERSRATGMTAALLVSAGWFGRRRLRVDADAIEALIPAESRVIVDETRVTSVGNDGRSS